jgi:hypothetical protein
MKETLVVVEAPHFYAGVVAREGRVIEVAPILYRHIKRGWTGRQVADYCRAKGWTWERVVTLNG